MKNKNWTKEEIYFLVENYEEFTDEFFSKKLNRSIGAIRKKAWKLGLKRLNIMSATQVSKLLKVDTKTIIKWKAKGLRMAKTNAKSKNSTYKIRVEILFNFLHNNQELWDASRVEIFALGQEPIWLQAKRKRDSKTFQKGKVWNKEEEARLIMLRNRNLTNKEISKLMGRTDKAVSRKYCNLYHNKIKKVV